MRRHAPKLVLVVAAAALAVGLAPPLSAQPSAAAVGRPPGQVLKKLERLNPSALKARLKSAGFKRKGGIAREKTESHDGHFRSLPHFSSSFTFNGQTFDYTMVGHAPATGSTARLRSVIIPLNMKFVFFENDALFDSSVAVDNILKSPLYQEAQFPTEFGQLGDAFQRATFWNKMDPLRRWHTKMARPRVAKPVTVLVEPDIGQLIQIGPGPNDVIGQITFGALDSQLHTIIQLTGIDPDEVPIFITQNVFADQALGYHDAFGVPNRDGTETFQTLIYSSWLDGNLVGDLFADISTLDHEVAEWLDDPFVNNIVPVWAFPPSNETCSDNPFLEVGDPIGNGPEFDAFPNFKLTLNGFTYHIQNLAMVPWFAHEVPSSARNGDYSWPDPTQLRIPAVECGSPTPPGGGATTH